MGSGRSGFCRCHGDRKIFYTGHSHGAGIGWHLCMNHPDRLRGFFASGSGPHLRTASQPALPAWTPSTQRKAGRPGSPMRKSRPLTVPRRLFLWSLTPSSAERPKKAVEQTVEFWTNMPAQSAVLNPRKPFAKVPTEEELAQVLGRITVPTIMMGGTEDNISSPRLMLRTLRALKGSKLVLHQGWTMLTFPLSAGRTMWGILWLSVRSRVFCNPAPSPAGRDGILPPDTDTIKRDAATGFEKGDASILINGHMNVGVRDWTEAVFWGKGTKRPRRRYGATPIRRVAPYLGTCK